MNNGFNACGSIPAVEPHRCFDRYPPVPVFQVGNDRAPQTTHRNSSNYGDTPSNTDLRCGLEGVGTTMRTANLRGHAARPLERPRGRCSTSFRPWAMQGHCLGITV